MKVMHVEDHIEQFLAEWDEAGLPAEIVAPASNALERYAAIRREWQDMQSTEPEVVNTVAEKVARGEVGFVDGLAELHLVEAAFERGQGNVLRADTRGVRLAEPAKRATLKLAVDSLAGVVGVLEEASADLVDRVRKLGPSVEGIETAEDALDAGGNAAKAWERLTGELERELGALQRVWASLQRLEVVTALPAGMDPRSRALGIAQAAA